VINTKYEHRPSNRKIVETEAESTPTTHIHDRLLFLLDTDTSTQSGDVKLVLWAQASTLTIIVYTDENKLPCIIPYTSETKLPCIRQYTGENKLPCIRQYTGENKLPCIRQSCLAGF
jgi:hypothetical protein